MHGATRSQGSGEVYKMNRKKVHSYVPITPILKREKPSGRTLKSVFYHWKERPRGTSSLKLNAKKGYSSPEWGDWMRKVGERGVHITTQAYSRRKTNHAKREYGGGR